MPHKTRALIAAWAERWPRCFALAERRPLKAGIHADILVASQGALRPIEIKLALRCYCHSFAYLQACTAGAERIDLDGHPVGVVTAAEAAFAAERLTQHKPNPSQAARVPAPVKRLGLGDLRDAARARRERSVP